MTQDNIVYIDGVLHRPCRECNGWGQTICPTCQQHDGECPSCNGTGMVPVGEVPV